MTSLAELFPDGPRNEAVLGGPVDDRHTVRRLSEMFGAPRTAGARAAIESTPEEVAAVVSGVTASSGHGATHAPDSGKRSTRRERRRIDATGITVSALALAAVISAGTVGAVQAATQDPVAEAVASLRQDEGTIANAMTSLVGANDALLAKIATEIDASTSLRATLDTYRTTLDPREPEEDQVIFSVLDVAGLDAEIAEIDAHIETMSSLTLPEMPDAFTPAVISEDSLTSVADAVDHAQEQLGEIDAVSDAVASAAADVDALIATQQSNLAAYAATVPAMGTLFVDTNPDAAQELKDAVSETAQAVADGKLASPDAIAALEPYRDAVFDLLVGQREVQQQREEEAAAEAERLAQEEADRQYREWLAQQPQPEDPGVVDPTPAPTDPTLPTDPTVPTDPTDPTDPGNGGGGSPTG